MQRSACAAAILWLAASPALAVPSVVADLVPTGALVQDVMGDLGDVRVLLPGGASAHHYQMRPSDAQALQSADLVFWMGPSLTPWLARATGNIDDEAQVRLLELPGLTLRGYAGAEDHDDHEAESHDDHGHDDQGHEENAHGDHGHDHGHDSHDEAAEDHADHSHAGTDPHAWLDPDNAAVWLTAIAAALSREDPENAATYQANADAAAARIAALDATLGARLAPHAGQRFVVFHDAYGYFTDHFGLQPAVPVSLGDASTPSAARIGQVRSQIIKSGAVCAFPEYAHDPVLIDTVIEGSNVRLGEELSPEGGTLEHGIGQYDRLLTNMAQTLIACFEAE
ncbi:zinc ABC transporter substrate-binding protein [Paracoccus sp. T5]|uniref:zinc ABC transporter substrate-binding protein n=1 Tax=Paracoccus sp. T5 TaxID=3402161 RepID=UPI003AE1490A